MSNGVRSPYRLDGRRILVLGGSVGIGKEIGQALYGAGAHVAFAARRKALCEEVAHGCGGRAIGLGCDVTDESECQEVVSETVNNFGGLDDLIYAAGLISLGALAEVDGQIWRRTMNTNVVGAALLTRAALPHLQQSAGKAVYLSSVSSRREPWPGLGVYTASKAALNRMIETWRSEHPELGFTTILLGPVADAATGTEFHPSALPLLSRHGNLALTSGAMCSARSVAEAVWFVLGQESRIWEMMVQPNDPPLPWSDALDGEEK